jgi:hypothetical protein
MPKGTNISKEKRFEIWKLMVLDNLDPQQILNSSLFRGDVRIISLERLKHLSTMFFNNEEKTIEYLAANSHRGNPGFEDFELIDFIMTELVRRNPLSTIEFYRAQITAIRGIGAEQYSLVQVRLSLRRCRLALKRNTYVSSRQDPERIEAFMQNIQVINPARFVNFDQCSASAEVMEGL